MDKNGLVKRYLEWLDTSLARSEKTIEQYGQTLHRLVTYASEQQRDITALDLSALEGFTGMYLHQMGLRPASRGPAVAAVRGFYKWAQRRGHVAENVAAELPRPKIGQALPSVLTLAEAERLIMAPGVDDYLALRDTCILAVLMGCGPRISGLWQMNESSLIWFQDEKDHEQLMIKFTEKGKQERIVPAPVQVALLLRAYLGHPYLDEVDRTLPNGDKVLWLSIQPGNIKAHEHYGEKRRLSRASIRDLIVRWGTVAKIDRRKLHPHALRHMYGTELAESDVSLIERQRLMGHAKPESTAIYDHTAMRKLRNTVKGASPMAKIKSPATELAKRLLRST